MAGGAMMLLGACGDTGAAGDDHPDPDISLNVGVAPDFFYTHYVVAVEEGFMAAEGIDASLTEFPSGREASEAIIVGQADLTGTTAATLSVLAGSDNELLAIASDQRGDGWFNIVTSGEVEVEDSSDLPGLNIATEHSTVLDQHVRTFLAEHEVHPDEIVYDDVNIPQLVTGLARGDFEAASMWEPNVSTALRDIEGAEILLDSDEVLPLNGYTAAGPQITSDPDVAVRVLTALDNAITWMEDNPDEVIDRVMDISGIQDEELARTVQEKISYDLAFEDEHLEDIYVTRDFYEEQAVIDETSDEQVENMYDKSFFETWDEARVE
jgi:NitT/TauT family transport system substrate-binding protein